MQLAFPHGTGHGSAFTSLQPCKMPEAEAHLDLARTHTSSQEAQQWRTFFVCSQQTPASKVDGHDYNREIAVHVGSSSEMVSLYRWCSGDVVREERRQ